MGTSQQFEKNAKEINKVLGFNNTVPYSRLYGTTNLTWGRGDASMWFVSYSVDDNYKIKSYEVNSTYFKPTEKQRTKAQNLIDSFNKTLTV